MTIILYSIATLGILGIIYGLGLALASKKFHVEVDPKIEQINEVLPQANCGACGLPGCSAYAEAIVNKGEDINLCAPGGESSIKEIARIMGIKASTKERNIAVIHCQSGGYNNTFFRYEYQGIATCKAAVLVTHGPNLCNFGCVFQNDCIAACHFDALHLDENGIRVVDKEKCTGCGACAKACPRNLIEMVPISKKVHILCSSHDKGVEAKKRCGNKTACISCGLCVKKCPVGAIEMKDDLAVIDYEKCISCGECAKVCPTGAIIDPLAGKRKKAYILEENCIGCTICAKKCPVDAITGEVKKLHVVDQEKCIGCEICFEKCPKEAIEMR
ncbi:MAG TPA: RnfABCDGE type electron transport complex subunit B [Candidatus Cloacimonetes bacterium]|nr:RnfABCDGE type electron transport complex subunit B [Candidatus Cloacimonadota bacterium]